MEKITDSSKLRCIAESIPSEEMKKDLREMAKKIDDLGIGNIPTSEESYRMKLICLLESLECQDIPGLVKKSSEHLKSISEEITKWAKIGASVADIRTPIPDKMLGLSEGEFKTISSSLRVAHSNCQNHLFDIGINEESRKIINKQIKNIKDLSKKLEVQLMEREMPDFGEMVLVKVRIPDTEEVRHDMCGCQGEIYICSGIRFDADGDFGIIWEVFPFPVIEVTDADIISWKKMPKDI